MKLKTLLAGLLAGATLGVMAAQAADLAIVSGDTGTGLEFLRSQLDRFEQETGNKVTIVPMPSSTTDQFGQYKLWLAAGNSDIDVYQTDVIWAPQLADQFLDLTEAAKDVVADHFPSIIESQTVNGKLVALPALPTLRRSTTARTCSRSTASPCRRPGPSSPRPPRKSRTLSALPVLPTCRASCSRAMPMKA